MAVDLTDSSLKQAWDSLTEKDGKTNWILFSFENDKSTKLIASGNGSGGLDELKSSLQDDQIHYGAFRVIGVDNRDTTVSRRPKYIWFTWIGTNLSVLKKARTSTQKPFLAKFFQSAQLNLELSGSDDLTKNEVGKRLLASGGAHKPTYYEFADGDTLNIADIQ
jgi:hypothetical protein